MAKRRKKGKPNPDVHRFIKHYYDEYKFKYKCKPPYNPGKDSFLIKKLLTQYGSLDFLKQMLRLYMFSNEDVVRKYKHSINIFYMQREDLADRVRRTSVGRQAIESDAETKREYEELKKKLMKRLLNEPLS